MARLCYVESVDSDRHLRLSSESFNVAV